MSYAIKYTPRNGKIHLVCTCDDCQLSFSVEDTGRGISEEDLVNIFDRFYQVDKIHPDGSGIGLSLAKAFVELHSGNIEVESVAGKGSKFTVLIPVCHVEPAEDIAVPRVISESEMKVELNEIVSEAEVDNDDRPLLLVIDDNADIRMLIRELLSTDYRIIEAQDGRQGIRLASKYVPDLIICDVMMPVMDGMECCRLIKEEISTSHIPILMLTACSMDEQRIQGYESGADGYLSKPFDSKMLKMRCENLIENRKRVNNVLGGSANLSPRTAVRDNKDQPTSKAPGDIENAFYGQFVGLVNKEIGNPDLNIDSLAAKMGLGRSQFYRKIKALTNYSPVELLRKIRLTKARDMLSSTDKTISEIAYEVGFSAPAYFTKVFRETYGESPSEMRTRLGIKV